MILQLFVCGRLLNGNATVLLWARLLLFAALLVLPVAAWPGKLYPDAAIYLYGKGSMLGSVVVPIRYCQAYISCILL